MTSLNSSVIFKKIHSLILILMIIASFSLVILYHHYRIDQSLLRGTQLAEEAFQKTKIIQTQSGPTLSFLLSKDNTITLSSGHVIRFNTMDSPLYLLTHIQTLNEHECTNAVNYLYDKVDQIVVLASGKLLKDEKINKEKNKQKDVLKKCTFYSDSDLYYVKKRID